jgi:hypothetical protein
LVPHFEHLVELPANGLDAVRRPESDHEERGRPQEVITLSPGDEAAERHPQKARQ